MHICLAVLAGCIWLMAWVFNGSGVMPVVLRMCQRCWISLAKKLHLLSFIDMLTFYIFWKLVWGGIGVSLLYWWQWLYHPSKQWQKENHSRHLSWVPENMQALMQVQKVLWCIHNFRMVKWRLSWVSKTHSVGCSDILLIDPRLRGWEVFHTIQL